MLTERTRQRILPQGLCALIALLTAGCMVAQPMLVSDDVYSPLPLDVKPEAEVVEPLLSEEPGFAPPLSASNDATPEPWEMTLDEAIQIALANSSVLREIGGAIIRTPALQPTIYGPSIQATDPRFGVEAALSAFDASFSTTTIWETNDRALNNALLGGGVNLFKQDLFRVRPAITKRAATGTQYTLSHLVEQDRNNATRNLFPLAWSSSTEFEVRHPLLQGSGAVYNRIAGPSEIPGVANGVLIAQVNTKISALDFQLELRDYLSNIENAYWDLNYAFRDLDAKKRARDRTLATLNDLKARKVESAQEAQAREQYFRLQNEVENALTGRLEQRTRTFNGSPAGNFQSSGGVYVAERQLRYIMGLPINDGRLIQPTSEPPTAETVYDWNETSATALSQRTELVKQELLIKRRDYELVAARNFLKPQLDFVGTYRLRGLGDHLYDFNVPIDNNTISSARNEWQVGLELAAPLGFRQGNSGVRNSELRRAQEQAILREMQRRVVHDLSNAVSESKRAHVSLKSSINRLAAANDEYKTLLAQAPVAKGESNLSQLLDSERRVLEAELATYRAHMEYALALKNVHFEMGSLLDYYNIHLAGQQATTPPLVSQEPPAQDVSPARAKNQRMVARNTPHTTR